MGWTRRIVLTLASAALAAAGLGLFTTDARAQADPGTLVVRFNLPALADSAAAAQGDAVAARLNDGYVLVRIGSGRSLEQALRLYRFLPGVAAVEPNYIATADLASPNDPQFANQWAWGRIAAVNGWTVYPGAYTGSGGPLVAVLDSGADFGHPDLQGALVTGANCLSGSCTATSVADDNGHGTHVSGTVAARTNNGVGVAGTAFNARVLVVKVLDAGGSGSYAGIAAGINYAVSQGARVVNMSLSGTSTSTLLCNAVSSATAQGVVIVAAAGNRGNTTKSYPAACAGAIGVSATTSSDVLASWSSRGVDNVFVSAPGDTIRSTLTGGGYGDYSGTSMASPHVAGLAALLLGQSPGRTVADVKRILATTSDKIGSGYTTDPYGTCSGCTWSSSYGYGRINLQRALQASPPPPQDTSPPTTPGNLQVSGVTQTGASLSWSASTDDIGVAGYRLYLGATEVGTTTALSFGFGLACNTSYTLGVAAYDASGKSSATATAPVTTPACTPPPPTVTEIVTPTGVTTTAGTFVSGTAASLLADDNGYYTVRSAGLFGSAPTWYASFTGVAATVTALSVTYKGLASRTCTQTVAVYDWTTSAWTQVSSTSVGTAEVLLSNLAPSGTPTSRYRSSTGEVRVRVSCSVFSFSAYTVSGELMQLAITRPA